ncbi:MAG TPA: DUF72 domain-containing protein [Dehalococcoidia bacterium]|nr:DUF72 domain-containing protein [Dehalococcoidia bacterium]
MRYHIGTSGWQYDHWRRRFYPQGLPKARWFEHYAREFATVELNNTFYRQPKAATWQKWQEAAPPGFCYAVKANRFITHIKRFRDCEAPLKRFLEGAQALGEHLGPVLFQTPPNFHRDDENLERLDGFLELLPQDVSSVFEFRHESWFDDDAGVKLLDRHRVGFCVQDYPGLECPVVATGDFAYVRFHGAGTRYGGNYPDDALREWAKRIEGLSRSGTREAWVYFNNDLGGHAVENARTLAHLLQD